MLPVIIVLKYYISSVLVTVKTPAVVSLIFSLVILVVLPLLLKTLFMSIRVFLRWKSKSVRCRVDVDIVKEYPRTFLGLTLGVGVLGCLFLITGASQVAGVRQDLDRIQGNVKTLIELTKATVDDVLTDANYYVTDRVIRLVDKYLNRILQTFLKDPKKQKEQISELMKVFHDVKDVVYFYSDFSQRISDYVEEEKQFNHTLEELKRSLQDICFLYKESLSDICETRFSKSPLFISNSYKINRFMDEEVQWIKSNDFMILLGQDRWSAIHKIMQVVIVIDNPRIMTKLTEELRHTISSLVTKVEDKALSLMQKYHSAARTYVLVGILGVSAFGLFVVFSLLGSLILSSGTITDLRETSCLRKCGVISGRGFLMVTYILLIISSVLIFVLYHANRTSGIEEQMKLLDKEILDPLLNEKTKRLARKTLKHNLKLERFINLPESIIETMFLKCRSSPQVEFFKESGISESFDLVGLVTSDRFLDYVQLIIDKNFKKYDSKIDKNLKIATKVISIVEEHINIHNLLKDFKFMNREKIISGIEFLEVNFVRELKVIENELTGSKLNLANKEGVRFQKVVDLLKTLPTNFQDIQVTRRGLVTFMDKRETLHSLINRMTAKTFIIHKVLPILTSYEYRMAVFKDIRKDILPLMLKDAATDVIEVLKNIFSGFKGCYDYSIEINEILDHIKAILSHWTLLFACLYGSLAGVVMLYWSFDFFK